MKKLSYLIVLVVILGLVLTGCLLSNVGQVPTSEQSGIVYLTKGLPSSLVGWWRFSEEEGNIAYDSSVYGNNGTVNGAIYDLSPMGWALNFDGLDDYVNCGSGDSLKPTQNITIEMWVKPSSTQNQYADILGGHQNNQGYVVQQDSNDLNNYYFAYNMNGTGTGWQGMWIKTSLIPDVWNHFVVQKEGSIIRHFLNGTLSASGTVLGDIWYSSTEPFYIGIGWNLGSNRYFKGSINDVRIWNFALSEGQLGKVYDFEGFFSPVENPGESNDIVNAAKAGRAIPVKFSLNGDQGLDIFEYGYPKSTSIVCGLTDLVDDIEDGETVTAGGSSLNYDAVAGQYIYVWKTDKRWADNSSCRQLVVKLNDGQSYYANFKFK